MLCIIGGYLFLLLLVRSPTYGHFTTCPFKLATGIPCPGCGMGRATVALSRGDIGTSLHYNLLCIPFTLGILILLVWMTADLLKNKETIYPYLMRPTNRVVGIALLIVVLINWVVNIMHHL